MEHSYILSILYEMALAIGGEVSVKPLLTRMLQRLLYHTSFPAGFVCIGKPFPEVDSVGMIEVRIDAAVGDYELAGLIGQTVRLPARLLLGAAERGDDDALLAWMPGKSSHYKAFLRLPIDGEGVVVLLAPQFPKSDLPLTQLFQPVMASLAKAIVLCKSHDAYTAGLIAARDASLQAQAFSEEKFRAISSAVLDALIMVDDSSALVYWNPAAERILGYRADEVLGKPLHQLLTPQRYQYRAIQGFNAFRCNGQGAVIGKTIEIEALHKDGHEIPVELSISALKLNDRWHAVGILRDITEHKRAEENLRKVNERYSLASRAARLGVWDWDIQKNQLVWDDGMYALYGVKREDFAGAYEAWLNGLHPDDRAASDEASKQAQRGEREYDTEFRVVWPDGSIHHLKAYGQFVRDADGRPLRMTGVNYDVTERKRAEDRLRCSERGLSEAQRIAHLGNWELDLESNALTWSDEIFRIFEIDPERFGASYEAFLNAIHPDDRDLVNKAYTDSVKSRLPYDIVHRLRMSDGRIKYVNEKCETYYGADGKPLRSVGTVHDITERKRAEDEVRELNQQLERRVAERTAQLEAANKELEAFAYSVSHDLRAPLRHIDGYVELLVSRCRDRLDDKGLHYVDTIAAAARQMGVLIDDLLQFSRTGRAELRRESVDMNQVLREVLGSIQESSAERGIEWVIGNLPPVRGDAALLRQVWANLLENAVKFTRPREDARIEVSAREENGETIFLVADNGVGFDMQYVGKLFGVFQRLHSQEEFEGTGIGLATVQRIVNRHGGRVWAEAELDQGATFYFALPRVEEKCHV